MTLICMFLPWFVCQFEPEDRELGFKQSDCPPYLPGAAILIRVPATIVICRWWHTAKPAGIDGYAPCTLRPTPSSLSFAAIANCIRCPVQKKRGLPALYRREQPYRALIGAVTAAGICLRGTPLRPY